MTFKETILQEVLHLLRQEGIARFTEQNIIKRINISSATFREFFRNMEDMVAQVLAYDLETRKQEHARLFSTQPSPLQRLLIMVQLGLEALKLEKPMALLEIIEHYPRAWATYWENSNSYTTQVLHEILNDGVLQGELRKDINIQLVTKILIEQLSMMMNPGIFPPDKYNISEIFRSIFFYYIRGLCAEKGMKTADEFFASLK